MLSLLSDGIQTHHVMLSVQIVILWKRKLYHLAESQEDIVPSGSIVHVDETYVGVGEGQEKRPLEGSCPDRGRCRQLREISYLSEPET